MHGPDGMISIRNSQPERAFLVAVEFRRRSRSERDIELPPSAVMARDVAAENRANAPSPAHGLEESLAEFRELARSAGAEVAGEFVQRRDQPDPATLIGKGKLQEIAGAAASSHADLIILDHELSPSQQRNIENEIDAREIGRAHV